MQIGEVQEELKDAIIDALYKKEIKLNNVTIDQSANKFCL